LRMLHGNFLIKVPPVYRGGHVVIGERLAIALFSKTDCVGSEISLGGSVYVIVGVIAKPDAITDLSGTLEEHAVYIYHDDTPLYLRPPEKTFLLVKCRENTAGMVLSRLSVSGLDAIAEVNHDANARFGYFAARLLLLIGVCLPLSMFTRKMIEQIKNRGFKRFFREFYHESAKIAFVPGAFILLGAALYLLSGLRLTLDARMIPESLASLTKVAEKLRMWFRLVNNGRVSGGMLDPQIRVYARLAQACAAAALTLAYSSNRIISHHTKQKYSHPTIK